MHHIHYYGYCVFTAILSLIFILYCPMSAAVTLEFSSWHNSSVIYTLLYIIIISYNIYINKQIKLERASFTFSVLFLFREVTFLQREFNSLHKSEVNKLSDRSLTHIQKPWRSADPTTWLCAFFRFRFQVQGTKLESKSRNLSWRNTWRVRTKEWMEERKES